MSFQGKSASYQVTVQKIITSALLNTGANTSIILEKLFRSLPHTPQLLKVCMHKVTSATVANLALIGQYNLTVRLGNKQLTDGFIRLGCAKISFYGLISSLTIG